MASESAARSSNHLTGTIPAPGGCRPTGSQTSLPSPIPTGNRKDACGRSRADQDPAVLGPLLNPKPVNPAVNVRESSPPQREISKNGAVEEGEMRNL